MRGSGDGDGRSLARAGAVIALGAVTVSVVGFARSLIVARLFGAHTATDAFFAAQLVPQLGYVLLAGGAVSAVLIPTFSRLAVNDPGQMWLLVRTVLALEIILTLVMVAVLEPLAHPLMLAVASGFQLRVHGNALSLSTELVQVMLPILCFSSLSGVALATLYSLGRRVAASFSPAAYHLAIMGAALVGAARWGIMALAVGAVLGAALQLALQIPALIGAWREHPPASRQPLVDFRHPAVARLLRLYLPVVAGLLVTTLGQALQINFSSRLPQNGGLSGMQYAYQIVQFPLGIVATALPWALLPAISRRAGEEQRDGFAHLLALGLRASLLLMIPAMVGLLVLATPITAFLFQRGQFTVLDTAYTARALLGYAPQLPLVAVNQMLVFAFYARSRTHLPAYAGGIGVLVYLIAVLLLGSFSILGLALADTISVAGQTLFLLLALLAGRVTTRENRLPKTAQ